MKNRSAGNPERKRGGPKEDRSTWTGVNRAGSRRDGPETESPPGRPWPSWACWLVSLLLLFHLTAVLVCELAGQVIVSPLESDLGNRFWWYTVLVHQDLAHSYFAPEPDPATPVVKARLAFSGGRPERTIRLPDRSTRPHIRYLRQIALAWHLVHEWSEEGTPPRSFWAASYARHLCRTNPGCRRVELTMEFHQMANPEAVVAAASRGETPDLDALESYSLPELIGAFSCDDF